MVSELGKLIKIWILGEWKTSKGVKLCSACILPCNTKKECVCCGSTLPVIQNSSFLCFQFINTPNYTQRKEHLTKDKI